MSQPCGVLGLRVKTLHVAAAGEMARQNHFHRHYPIQAALMRLVHYAHTAAAQFMDQFIVAKLSELRLAVNAVRTLVAHQIRAKAKGDPRQACGA